MLIVLFSFESERKDEKSKAEGAPGCTNAIAVGGYQQCIKVCLGRWVMLGQLQSGRSGEDIEARRKEGFGVVIGV